MATDYKTINTYPQGTPSGTDRLPYFDAGGTIRYTQVSDFQEVLPPPNLWQKIICEDIRVAYKVNNYFYSKPLSEAASVASKFIGLYLPKVGYVVLPY